LKESVNFRKLAPVLGFVFLLSGCFFFGPDRSLVVQTQGVSGLAIAGAEVYLDERFQGQTNSKGQLRIDKPRSLLNDQALLTVSKSNSYVEYKTFEERVLLDLSRKQFVTAQLEVQGAALQAGQKTTVLPKSVVNTQPRVALKKSKSKQNSNATALKPAKTKANKGKSARQRLVEGRLKSAKKAARRSAKASEQTEKIMHANNAFHTAEDALAAAKKLSGSSYVRALRSYRETMDTLYKSVEHEAFRQKRDRADKMLLSH
jgi:hypothetical protein